MQIIILMTLLTLLPAIVMSITPVLADFNCPAFSAAGNGNADSTIESGTAGAFVFSDDGAGAPLGTQIYNEAWQPMERGEMTTSQAWDTGSKPLKGLSGPFCS